MKGPFFLPQQRRDRTAVLSMARAMQQSRMLVVLVAMVLIDALLQYALKLPSFIAYFVLVLLIGFLVPSILRVTGEGRRLLAELTRVHDYLSSEEAWQSVSSARRRQFEITRRVVDFLLPRITSIVGAQSSATNTLSSQPSDDSGPAHDEAQPVLSTTLDGSSGGQ